MSMCYAWGMLNQITNIDDWLTHSPIRPNWDVYYMTIAFVVAQRSFDPSTKCGCVIVSKDNRVLSTGYNGPIKGSSDHLIPTERPLKYMFFIHSEENSILAYNGSQQDIANATAYITSPPCHRCLRMLLQKGITKIIHSDLATKVVDQADLDAQRQMLSGRNIEFKVIPSIDINTLLLNTMNYITNKAQTP